MSNLRALLMGAIIGTAILLLCCSVVRAETIIIDTDEPGTAYHGIWTRSGGADPYGDDSLYSKGAGDTYTFEAAVNGTCEVSLWWTEWPSRLVSVPVEIYDGDTLLDTVHVDQTTRGGQWNVLGTYTFTNTPSVVILSEGNGSTCVDAMKVETIEQQVETVEVVVEVTWNKPSNAGDWAGLQIRVNGDDSTIIDITDSVLTTWTGTMTLNIGENVFEMLAYDGGGQHSEWSEPAHYTLDEVLHAPIGISVKVTR